MIRDTVKKFARNEIAPHSAEWDEAETFPRELFNQGAELGLFGIRIDPEWGGSGLDWWAPAAYVEGLSWSENGGCNMAFIVQSDIPLPALAELGAREQREDFVRPPLQRHLIYSLATNEPAHRRLV